MKNLTLFLIIFLSNLCLFSQNRQDYFVVAKLGYSLDPIQTITNLDQTLTIQLTDNNLESFLNSKPVYAIQKAFPTAGTPFLQRTYRISLDNDTHINDFFSRNEIEHVELVEEENIELYIPNDYDYIDRESPNTALEVIKAPLAWNLTHGDPNIIAGVLDNGFFVNHEDLVNEIVLDLGSGAASHGTSVSSAVAGQTDNNVGLASIGFETKLAIKSGGQHNGALLLSQQTGVKVINISLKFGCTFSPVADSLFSEIWNGTGGFPPVVVVAAAGNGKANQQAGGNGWCPDANGEANGYVYPAAYDNVIAVSALNHLVPRGTEDFEFGFGVNWEDLALRDINDPNSTTTYNDKVDLSAPGRHVMAANDDSNGYGFSYGTSIASPIVVGTVALMFAVNPNLTPDDVRNILRNTTDDIYFIPENAPFTNLYGTGRLNSFRAVQTAQCMANPTTDLDLAMQNSNLDDFSEPDNETQQPWRSEDIWIRNQNDGREVRFHENPEYDPNNPNYVYVRVTNNSCEASTGTDNLKLYWAKANTALSWPLHWEGNLSIEFPIDSGNFILMGDEIATLTIPPLEIGQEAIIEFEWNDMPNPEDYIDINDNPWHFCLLARIDTPNDPMTFLEGEAITQNVLNNNNISWKNTTVVDIIPDTPSPIGGVVAVGNYFSQQKAFTLELVKENNELGKSIYEEAEVTIEMDDVLYNAWVEGGKVSQNSDSTKIANKKIITGNNAVFNNIILDPSEIGTVYLTFNFLTKELTNKREFIYHLIQRDAITNEIIGGETFEIRKKPRDSFSANAGNDEEIDKNETITITAGQINEDAVYNWYDPEGNLIYTGTDLTVSPDVTKSYKLEIISNIDGFKDYDEVEITVNPYKLESLVPNPASQSVTVNYMADGASSGYVMVVNMNTGSSDNYILDVQQATTSIDVSTYTTGLYNIILVCDGEIQNSKILIKQ